MGFAIFGGIIVIIEKGVLLKEKHEREIEENYIAKLVSYEALDDMVKLMDVVYEALPNKEVLFVDSYDDLYEDLNKGAKIIGIYGEENNMIAFRYVSFPGLERRNLGYDLGLPEEELHKLCQLETTVVDPPYRGNNIQFMTLSMMKPIIAKEGYKHMACTISPYNFYSVNNIMRHGLKIKSLKRKYGTTKDNSDGIWRYILHGTLGDNLELTNNDKINIEMTNIDAQVKLLNNGYIGYKLYHEDQTLDYVRFSPPY